MTVSIAKIVKSFRITWKVRKDMASRAKRPCNYPGCPELVSSGYCTKHTKHSSEYRRGTAQQRGYNYKWSQYSKRFLKQPGNHLCALKISPRCAYVSECVDHRIPPKGPDDPLFWDKDNHQPACIACNSMKGNRV